MLKKKIILFFIYLISISSSHSLELIRDVELESFTRELISLIDSDSEINNSEINLYFINSKEVNAFVTSSSDMFINTGLITSSNDYVEFVSVLAHELSHINGFRVSRSKEEISNLGKKALPVYLLGILGIMSGATDLGIATVMVGSASVQGGYLSYSRTQEAAADQGAVKLMCENFIDASGLMRFLKTLEGLPASANVINPYNTTHPITENRYAWVESALEKYNGCKFDKNEYLQKQFKMLQAKLFGYTHKFDEVNSVFDESTDEGKYALSVSMFFNGESEKPIKYLSELVEKDAKNAYYKELLAEIYYSKQDYHNAIIMQKKALDDYGSESDLLYMLMGNYLMFNKDTMNDAVKYLKRSIRINPKNTYSWYLLAKAYAENNLPLAHYATAERYYLINEHQLAHQFLTKSLKEIEKDTPEWYRANDLLSIMTRDKEKENKRQ